MKIKVKHAYCIIAHDEPLLLEKLVSMLDDPRNDIFIHVDKKTDINIYKNVKTIYSTLVYTKRIDVYWGGLSQVKCELLLLKTASRYGNYTYYHILSGTDLPIKTQNYIHWFCDEKNKGKEFVSISNKESNLAILERNTQYYYFFSELIQTRNKFLRVIGDVLRKKILCLQIFFGTRRNFDIELKKWHQWNSISDEFCKYLLSKERYILKTFKYINIPDEIFLQSMFWNSPFRDNAYIDEKGEMSSLRAIDWKRGGPYVWTSYDQDELVMSNALFARKFSSDDFLFIDNVLNRCKC